MKAHCFQHVPFEGMGSIENWFISNGFTISYTRFFENSDLPDINSVDWLIIMGGPMSVNDEKEFPWLVAEKEFIKNCIRLNKKVIGICLGAQIIANALGSRIYKNAIKEIGWFPIKLTSEENSRIKNIAPESFTVFHWHGETFELPEGAKLVASSENCQNQIFTFNNNVIGFQCHLETTKESLNLLIDNCKDELVQGKCIQNQTELEAGYPKYTTTMQDTLYKILDIYLN